MTAEIHFVLLEQINKIVNASRNNFNSIYLSQILPILTFSKNGFLFKKKVKLDNLQYTNDLIDQIINLSIHKRDATVFLRALKVYVENTKLLSDKLQDGFPYEDELLQSLVMYRRIIELITENHVINEEIIYEVSKILDQYIFSKLIVNYVQSRRMLSMFSKDEKVEVSELKFKEIHKRNVLNAELFDAVKVLFRFLITQKREIYAELLISHLRQALFKEIREKDKAGVIEQLFDILIHYLSICLEEKNHLANILFYTFRDVLDRIYDPNFKDLDGKKLINIEYLPIYKKYLLQANGHIIYVKDDGNRLQMFKNELGFFKDSRVFQDYNEIENLLLSNIFFSIGCGSIEKETYEYVDAIFDFSLSKPKDYVLVNENPILKLDIRDLLLQLETSEYHSLDAENIKSLFFLICILKQYSPKTKTEVKTIFKDFKPDQEADIALMRSLMLHERNFEVLLNRQEDIDEILKSIKGIKTKIKLELVIKTILDISKDFDNKIEEHDKKKELSKTKIENFLKRFTETYNKRTNIYQTCSKLETTKEPKLLYHKIKEDRIWFVDVSGTTAYASDEIGSDLGSNLAENELTILSQELFKEVDKQKQITSENFEDLVTKGISDLTGDLVFLLPRNKLSLIRKFIRYEYSKESSQEYLLMNNRRIEVYNYIDRNNLGLAFLFQKNAVKWRQALFSFKPLKGEALKFNSRVAEILFLEYADAKKEDQEYLDENDIIIITKFGYNIKIDKDKVKKFALTID